MKQNIYYLKLSSICNSRIKKSIAISLLFIFTINPMLWAAMPIGTNFWRIDWGGWEDYFKPSLNWSTVSDPWATQFKTDVGIYNTLRFMDWGPTNGSTLVNWANRIQKTDNHYTGNTVNLKLGSAGTLTTGKGVAYEWMIDLCNRTGKNMWICIPHQASLDFTTQLATLIKNRLNSNLKVYVEYSNECWNTKFYQTQWLYDESQRLGFANRAVTYQGNIAYPSPIRKAYVFYAMKHFQRFENVWGVNNSRVVKVIAGQLKFQNSDNFRAIWGDEHVMVTYDMALLNDSYFNPGNVRVNSYAMSIYWHGDNTTQMIANLNDVILPQLDDARRSLEGTGVTLIGYEGGQDGGNQVANAQNIAIKNVYNQCLTSINNKLQGLFCHYTHVGWGQNNAWGAKRTTATTLTNEKYKYDAIKAWKQANAREEGDDELDENDDNPFINSSDYTLTVFPNPVQTELYVACSDEVAKVQIIDPTGRVVLENTTPTGIKTFMLNDMCDGMYLVKAIRTNGSSIMVKFVKH